MDKQRKAFQYLPGNENPQFLEDGKRIYLELRNKYPKNTNEDLDNILNGLCAAMTCLMYDNVDQSNHKNFLQLIWKILNQNLEIGG
jgi:uncharacterized Zn-finger protein